MEKSGIKVPICNWGRLDGKKVVYSDGMMIPVNNWYQFHQGIRGWVIIEKWAWGYYIIKIIEDKRDGHEL